MAAAPWLSRPWRRTAWIALAAVAAARLITGTALPAELVLAFACGVTVGAAVLVAFGVPDRRIGSEGIAAALRSAGLPVASVEPAGVVTKGSPSSFVNRVSPANVGGMALNARFLQKNGVSPGAGVAAVGVNALMGAVAHLILLVIFFTLASHRMTQAFKLPPASKLLLILAVAAALAGIVLATRRGRRFAATRLLPGLRSAAVSLRTAAASPVKLTLLAGGSALITLAYIAGLAASVEAFGGRAGIAEIGAVYLGAAVIAAASPTPGGLGAIEAALVAGLTGIGVPPGPAVSAVLTYRLATYWLPVLPGWAALRLLQRRSYV